MRTRSTVMLMATALGAVLATPGQSFAATNTQVSTVSPPYVISVTSTLDPQTAGGATHATVRSEEQIGPSTVPYSVPAGDLVLRWELWYIPGGGTVWQLCKESDPTQFAASPNAGSVFTLDDSAFINPAQTACGDGVYDLGTNGAAFVNGAFHGVFSVWSGPEVLAGSHPPGGVTKFFRLRRAFAARAGNPPGLSNTSLPSR